MGTLTTTAANAAGILLFLNEYTLGASECFHFLFELRTLHLTLWERRRMWAATGQRWAICLAITIVRSTRRIRLFRISGLPRSRIGPSFARMNRRMVGRSTSTYRRDRAFASADRMAFRACFRSFCARVGLLLCAPPSCALQNSTREISSATTFFNSRRLPSSIRLCSTCRAGRTEATRGMCRALAIERGRERCRWSLRRTLAHRDDSARMLARPRE